MVEYCENVSVCRHVFLCKYFGESGVSKQTVCEDGARCDICRTPDKVAREKAEKLSNLQGTGRAAQYMGGSRTFIGSDGSVQVQAVWQSASVALGRYDANLIDDVDDEVDEDNSNSDSNEDSNEESESRENDDDYDSEAERKAKRRKLLFGMFSRCGCVCAWHVVNVG
jgi:bloom syndrome protein